MTRLALAIVLSLAGASALAEDLRPTAVHAKFNASNKVIQCPTQASTIKAYGLAANGRSFASVRGCREIPDGATVLVDCSRSNRAVAWVRFGGRSGVTSAEQIDETCAPR